MNAADQKLTEAAARRAHLEEKWTKAAATTQQKLNEYAAAAGELTGLAEDLAYAVADHQSALAAARL